MVIHDYTVHHIPLDRIDKNPLNPQSRGEAGDVKGLLESITENGLYYPILLNKKPDGRYMIIEGHRRFAVYQMKGATNAGFAAVPALMMEVGETFLTGIFREINETSRKLTGKQWLEVASLGGKPGDMPKRLASAIKNLGALFSTDELACIARNQGPSVYGLARRVADAYNYSSSNPDEVRKIVMWLVNSGDSVNVRVEMKEKNVDKVRDAIENGRRISGNPYPNGDLFAISAEGMRKAA